MSKETTLKHLLKDSELQELTVVQMAKKDLAAGRYGDALIRLAVDADKIRNVNDELHAIVQADYEARRQAKLTALRNSSIAEHDLVRLTAEVNQDGATFPIGTTGAVVSIYKGGQAFAVEIIEGRPEPVAITVQTTQLEVKPTPNLPDL
jgi:hypothetical protein